MGSLLQIFALMKSLAAYLPVILQVIHTVETIFPKATPGATKLEAAVNLVQNIATSAGVTAEQAAVVQPALAGTVSAMVTTVNAAGGFPSAAAPVNLPTVG